MKTLNSLKLFLLFVSLVGCSNNSSDSAYLSETSSSKNSDVSTTSSYDSSFGSSSSDKLSSTSISSIEEVYYTIEFKNYDGSLLYSVNALFGSAVVYGGKQPVRIEDEKYSYKFKGWDHEITKAICDDIYTAQYYTGTYQYDETSHWIKYENGDLSEETEHNLSKVHEQQSTCTTDGFTKFKCDTCSYEKTNIINKTGHNITYKLNSLNGDSATIDAYCITEDKVIETINSTSITSEITKESTYDSKGEKTYIIHFSVNGEDKTITYIENIDVLEDQLTFSTELNDDKTSGYIIVKHSNPNIDDEKIKAIVTSNIIKEATCTEDGTIKYSFTAVYNNQTIIEYKDDVIKAVGHVYEMTEVVPSCLIEGKRIYKCKNCDDSYSEDIEALGHNFVWVSNNDATCEEDGTKTEKCDRCGETKETITDTGSALGHSYVDSFCSRCKTYEYKEQISVTMDGNSDSFGYYMHRKELMYSSSLGYYYGEFVFWCCQFTIDHYEFIETDYYLYTVTTIVFYIKKTYVGGSTAKLGSKSYTVTDDERNTCKFNFQLTNTTQNIELKNVVNSSLKITKVGTVGILNLTLSSSCESYLAQGDNLCLNFSSYEKNLS